jgi:hypothetical protein
MNSKNKKLVLKLVVISVCFFLAMEFHVRGMERRIREDIRMNTALITTFQRTVPAVLYSPGSNMCVLVYPDSLTYKRPEWIKH